MTTSISAPKVVLLAVHLATKADIDSLTSLASQHDKVLHTELLLRILLTCLPETLKSSEYVSLLERIDADVVEEHPKDIDCSSVEHFTETEATKKVRRLRLLPLAAPGVSKEALGDPISLFLIQRAHRVDEEAGLLTQLPDLIVPFLDHSPCIRSWMISALLPLLRRNHEYYPDNPIHYTLSEFENLNDRAAVSLLLDQTGNREEDLPFIGRDLRGLMGPWLYNDARWKREDGNRADLCVVSESGEATLKRNLCPGWEQMLEWLTTHASKSWKVAVNAIEQWDGLDDVDLGGYGCMWFKDEEQGYLEQRYARAALASAYLIPEASVEALAGVNSIIAKIMALLDQDPYPTLQVASTILPPYSDNGTESMLCPKNATMMRNNLLEESNILTTPSARSTRLLHALTLSAFILTKAGALCTVRRAGELAFLQHEREQEAEALNFINKLRNNAPKADDKYWIRARNELMWLRDWGAEEAEESSHGKIHGVFGQLKKEFLEVECLKAFLSSGRYSLARSIFEDSPAKPLSNEVLEGTIIAAAMNAYDDASNTNRSRGRLLECDDIIHAFPKTMPENNPAAQRIEALLKATHGLSKYRLVLKPNQPFRPVVLRVHSDPISIIGKVLEQNPESHTRLQDFLEIGANMVEAGLATRDKPGKPSPTSEEMSEQRSLAEKRVTAMCVDAALTEDDFETAYSYVVNRLGSIGGSTPVGSSARQASAFVDDYSWKAALQAGKYRRTARTLRPTHIGTSSGNPDIRHLEKRMECLSAALRIAPPATLQEILNVFRRCEEELDAAVKTEDEQESAWDDKGDVKAMPGAFSMTVPAGVKKQTRAKSRQEEAPMSLFELSRVSMSRAQQNFNLLSSLQRSGQARDDAQDAQGELEHTPGQPKARKRDQLREAAVGTLASGVGWLIGAQPVKPNENE
ncbi:Sec39 domain-containing protein [Pseudomassariella vexata]|uniref:Sec39 domain-containing protein n=1 Tax=Pseudomassariella vexata TaxID=1141098 RepID=A0A1Y2EKC9_9PEZI|nr:Sec39 domain-containing protein [Pseudomassariella vexata]ORY71744.1 Sec39 domain-containing protein [Pseudomassariella vexata]